MPTRNKQGNGAEPLGFEDLLWKAADKLRGSMDAGEYKHVVLGLIFFKYVEDAFEERRSVLHGEVEADGVTSEQVGELLESRDEYTAEGVFWVPPEARWGYLLELRGARADGNNGAGDDVELETAVRQAVADAVSAGGVIDIYTAAGIERPDISIIDDDFARRLMTNPHPNVQIELLKRLLNRELKAVAKRNLIAERKCSEMLERAMRSYTNRSLDAAAVITELVELAEQMCEERDRSAKLGLRDDELAFYGAVCQNDSAVLEFGDDTLKAIAHELVAVVGRNATIDWDRKEQVLASLRRHIRRLLAKCKYPPDKQESAVALVMQRAELFAAEVAA